MKPYLAVVVATMLFGTPYAASVSAAGTAPAKILLGIDAVLVDKDGLHPLMGTSDSARVDVASGGNFNAVVELEPDRSDELVYKLSYSPIGENQIKLTLDRKRSRRGATETLPPFETLISVLDTWSTTLYEDTARNRRVVLRVLPELREAVDDEPLDAGRILMRLYGGPLIRYGHGHDDDRIVFREVNCGGAGIEFGIPNLGVVRLRLSPFSGAARVGWVRGTTMEFTVQGQQFEAWSTKEILPEDPERPGKGWILYGTLLPVSQARFPGGYYGLFQPEK